MLVLVSAERWQGLVNKIGSVHQRFSLVITSKYVVNKSFRFLPDPGPGFECVLTGLGGLIVAPGRSGIGHFPFAAEQTLVFQRA